MTKGKRKALRTMRNGRALQSCVMLNVFFVAKKEIDAEAELQRAEKYDDVRGGANAHLIEASAELRQLRMNIQQFDYLRPELPTLQNFTSYKQALCELVDSGLEALAEIYDREAKFASNDALELVCRASLRQQKDEFLHESSRVRDPGTRRWSELAILLEAGKAIIRAREAIVRAGRATLERPDLEKLEVKIKTGNALRLDTRRLEPEDILKLKEWFDHIAPGLYDRFEEDPDQVAILNDTKQAEPRFSEFCSHMIRTSLLFKDGPIPNRPERSTPRKSNQDAPRDVDVGGAVRAQGHRPRKSS